MDAVSPLGTVRLRRRLTVEEAAARARLELEDVRALEENRIYRFPSVENAVATTLVYATALGVSESEARQLAGLPVPPLSAGSRLRRILPIAVIVLLSAAVAILAVRPAPASFGAAPSPAASAAEATQKLPPPWQIRVDVYNGTDSANAATELANEIGGPLAYRLGTVENAERTDYVSTRVYYPPGAESIAQRLAGQLGVAATELPGGKDTGRLVVILGADRTVARN